MEQNQISEQERSDPSASLRAGKRQEEDKPTGKKKIPTGKLIGLIIVVVVIWFIGIQIMAAERYEMVVNVKEEENIMGVNPLGDSLDFGDLSRNLGATRYVTLKNDSKNNRYIMIWKRGEISDMVALNKNNFTLEPGGEEKLEFTIQIPPSAEARQYKGKVMIFRWPKIW